MSKRAEAAPPTGARVLVVDDELHVRSALCRSLSLLGYRADDAASGDVALKVLAREPYDVMVLDIRMPGVDGVEVMRRAHRMRPQMAIIVLTAHATVESAIAAVKTSAADYLQKPVSVHEVAKAIAQALRHRAMQAQPPPPVGVQDGGTAAALADHGGAERVLDLRAGRVLRGGPLSLDLDTLELLVATGGDVPRPAIRLTASEAALLLCLMEHPDAVLSCRELARDALGHCLSEEEARAIVRPHLCRIRAKLGLGPARRAIHTVRGRGYCFGG